MKMFAAVLSLICTVHALPMSLDERLAKLTNAVSAKDATCSTMGAGTDASKCKDGETFYSNCDAGFSSGPACCTVCDGGTKGATKA